MERSRVEKVVRELNLSLPSDALVQVELIQWETHVRRKLRRKFVVWRELVASA